METFSSRGIRASGRRKASRLAAFFLVFPCGLSLSACSIPTALQTGAQRGVYEDILERQREGIPVDTETLKELPELTVSDYEWLGDQYYKQEKFPLAYTKYEKAIELAPDRLDLHYKAGLVLLHKRMLDDAIARFDYIIRVNSGFSPAYEGKGRALLEKGELAGAELALRLSLDLDPRRERALQSLALVYERQGRHREALAELRKALEIVPRDAALLNNIGMEHYSLGEYEPSVSAFESALAAGGAAPRIYNNLGRAYAKLHRYKDAYSAFTKGSDSASAYFNLGVLMQSAGNLEKAAACFEHAIETSATYYEAAGKKLAEIKVEMGYTGPRDLQRSGTVSLPCP